jgi:2-polyprenyl-6-methoxyphenol hydroxylase-like FAD-dependent oxidoreductase
MGRAIGTVVVLGGSFAGMLAAAAAARAAERVVIVERDGLEGDEPRKGVPQGRHNHNLYARGREIVERLLPGVTEDLRARGAAVGDSGATGRWILGGHRLARVASGSAGVFASRPWLDAAMRARVLALPNVELLDGTDVLGLEASEGGARVSGVRVCARDAERGERTIAADVVIDATGRGSRTPAWLEALGHRAPEVEELEVRVSYATRAFRRRAQDLEGDRHVIVSGVAPDRPRGGIAFAVTPERWMVLLFAYAGERPSIELEAFRARAASLAPELASVASAEPLDDGATFTYPRAQRRRYDRLAHVPEGLLVLGDALVSTNPCWASGMTSAALQAEALERCIARGPRDLSRRWHAAAIAASADVWEATTSNDRAYACVEGEPPAPFRAIRRYIGALFAAASRDEVLARAAIRVVDRVAHPITVLAPWILLRVARAWLQRRRELPEEAPGAHTVRA